MVKVNSLVIPSCSGVLDCFNNKLSRYFSKESMCCLQGSGNYLLVLALFSFLYNKPTDEKTCSYTFKISEFKKFVGFSGGGKSKDIKAELTRLSEIGYVWQYSPEEKLLEIQFNETNTFATVKSQYFTNLYQYMASHKADRNRWGKKISRGKSSYSSMVFTSILKERTVSAVEISIEFVKLIERRGPLKQGETAHLSVYSLVERCPSLNNQLQGKEVKEQNRIIRSALQKSLELLKVHTELFNSFEELQFIFPKKITFSNECVINIIYSRRIF